MMQRLIQALVDIFGFNQVLPLFEWSLVFP